MSAPAEQPSVIYSYTDSDSGEERLVELQRGGSTLRRGIGVERESSRSSPDTELPYLPIPGQGGLYREDCDDEIPAFFCKDCGNPVYVGSTCQMASCERCWPSGVKREVVQKSRKLDGLRRRLYARKQGRKNFDFNHVVASLPSFKVDSDQPIERFLMLIKSLLEDNFGVEGFLAVYHPFRIKQEYRKDQYEHGGEPGQGDMTWKDVLGRPDWMKFVEHSPHFHLFFPLERRAFDYSTCVAIEEQTGVLFKRVTKGDSNVSVEDFEDLVHQLTYTYSHAGEDGGFVQRMKGWLHETNPPGDMEERALAAFSEAAPKLLGQKFVNVSESSCGEQVPSPGETSAGSSNHATVVKSVGHEIPEVERVEWSASSNTGFREDVDHDWDAPVEVSSSSGGRSESVETEICGGELVSISRAGQFLGRDEWCRQALYVDGLRDAHKEWKRLSEDRPTHDGVCPPPSEGEESP